MNNIESLSKFWKGKKVFLTGHTGFKGSWFSIFLNLLGAKVTGYSLRPSTKLNLFEADGKFCLTEDEFNSIKDFITDENDKIDSLLGESFCDSSFAFSEQLGLPQLFSYMELFIRQNK